MKMPRWVIPVIYLFYVSGIPMHIWERTRAAFLPMTEPLLLATGVVVLVGGWLLAPARLRDRYLIWLALTIPVTYALEVVGVETGLIFGTYEYGNLLGWQAFGVPLIIGLLWVQVALGSLDLTHYLLARVGWRRDSDRRRLVALPLGAGVFSVLFDWLLEPVAIALGYWSWVEGPVGALVSGEPPVQNYVAWFVIAVLVAAAHQAFRLPPSQPLARHVWIAQVIFFLGVGLGLGAYG